MESKNQPNSNSPSQALYLKQIKRQKIKIVVIRIFIFILFLIQWEVLSDFKIIDSFFFSSPAKIAKLFLSMCKDFEIFYHISITLLETIVSFLIVNVLSILIAVLLFSSVTVSKILEPYLVILNSLPKSALAPLLIVWLGSGMNTIIVAGISVAIFGSIINVYSGFRQVDSEKLKLIRTLGGSNKEMIIKVIIPSSVPIILSNMKVNIGLSLVGVIIGEFLSSKQGLGYLIIYGSQTFALDLLIMSIIILCIIAFILYTGIQKLENHFCHQR